METTRFRSSAASDRGGKSTYRKILFVSLIMAVMLALFPAVSVLAAPPRNPPLPEEEVLEKDWADELNQLATEITFFNNFRPRPEQSVNPANQGRQLDMYRAAIIAARTLAVNQTGFDDKGHVINQRRANQAVQELADYLNRIRGLKEKLRGGIPVTTTPQSITSDETAQNIGIQREWTVKRSQLAAEIAFFIDFRTRPGESGTDGNQGRYLDMYRAAVAQAQSIVANHDGFNASGQVIDADRASQSIQQLADALRMIRGLKEKLGARRQ
jgi:hypothetical protein